MLFLTEWAREFQPETRPWLILGKGPSYELIEKVDREQFEICSLNHVVRELPVTLAHVIDVDVVRDCSEAIEENARFLILPFRPHVDFDPTEKTVLDLLDEIPVLRSLEEQGRLVVYNLSSSKPHGDDPVIEAKFFSAEAALNLLAECGVEEVRSLGVDGGDRYGSTFDDLADTTRLSTGHASFDLQFESFANTIRRTGMLYAPWHVPAPVRVFVGSDEAQLLATRVLEFSIKKHASLSVDVQRVDNTGLPEPRDPRNRTRTGFSFGRFKIPELCGYQGRGVYVDADMLVFSDIARLWTLPFDGNELLYTKQPAQRKAAQFSVLLLDCERLGWDPRRVVAGLDEGAYGYKELMGGLCIVEEGRRAPAIPTRWNSLEHFDETTCLIHYTDMPTQPWVCSDNPNGRLWYRYLREAITEGFLTREFLDDEIRKGHVSPDLPEWAGLPRIEDYSALKARWVPPFMRYTMSGKESPRELSPEPPVRSEYEQRLEREPALEEFPQEWELRKGGSEVLWNRLTAERVLFDDPALRPGNFVVRLLILLEDLPHPGLADTLSLWSLQSVGGGEVFLFPPHTQARVDLERWLERHPSPCPVRIESDDPLAALGDDAWLVFARPGDLHHPGLVSALARIGEDADAVVWDSVRPSSDDRRLWRTPGLEPYTLFNNPYLSRAMAVRASSVAPFADHLATSVRDGDGHPLHLWLSRRPDVRWRRVGEALSVLVSSLRSGTSSLREAYEVALSDSTLRMSWQPATGRSLPYRATPPVCEKVISVIVPFRDAAELTCRCLGSVLDQVTHLPPELVLVDNQSRSESRSEISAFLRQRGVPEERIKWVEYPYPFNHSRQCNLGAEAASGEILVFLNNDAAFLDEATLQTLADWSALPDVGTAGCRLTTEGGKLLSAGWRWLRRRARSTAPVAESRDTSFVGWVRETPGNSFACAALRREVFEVLGPLDEIGFPTGYNDVEYCLRAAAQGYRHIYLGQLRVNHTTGASRPRSDETAQIQELWRRYPEIATKATLERERIGKPAPREPLPVRPWQRVKRSLPAGLRKPADRLWGFARKRLRP